MKKSLIVVITPSTSQPRYHKRISVLSKLSDVVIFSFRRGLYEVNEFQAGAQVFDLGRVLDKNYAKRIFPFIKAIFFLKRNLPQGYDKIQFYAFSVDCLFIAKLAGIKVGFLEIGDLIFSKNKNKLLHLLEKAILGHIKGLVLTSKEYYNQYYEPLIRKQGQPEVYTIENKISPVLQPYRIRDKSVIPDKNAAIVIGLVGFLRYRIPITRLLNFVSNNPKLVSLKVFGDGPYKQLIQEHVSDSIMFYGSFKNPDELPKIYSEIDLNYVVYDNRFLNVRLAIPNKLYESAFFQVPLICSPDTYLGQLAEEWGIGGTIRTDTQDHFDHDLRMKIDPNWINTAIQNCSSLPDSELIDHQEEVIQSIIN